VQTRIKIPDRVVVGIVPLKEQKLKLEYIFSFTFCPGIPVK
tara:strand:+ start:390 stop:512 length:123 start_codon:yes stop_codon:yes gene_type:complete